MRDNKKMKVLIEKVMKVAEHRADKMGLLAKTGDRVYFTDGYCLLYGGILEHIIGHEPKELTMPDPDPVIKAIDKRQGVREIVFAPVDFEVKGKEPVIVGRAEDGHVATVKIGDFYMHNGEKSVITLDNKYTRLADALGIVFFSVGGPLDPIHGKNSNGLNFIQMPIRAGK